jgi:hypothetical protein
LPVVTWKAIDGIGSLVIQFDSHGRLEDFAGAVPGAVREGKGYLLKGRRCLIRLSLLILININGVSR